MDIHKPKAAHSWREFAIEIGTIIAGILIALALEQAVEAHHWSEQVKDAHRALAEEVRAHTVTYARRIAQHPCVERRLEEVETVLNELDHGSRVGRVADFGRPVGVNYSDGVWRALISAGVAAHFRSDELVAYGKMYSVGENIASWNTMGGQDWSTIKLIVGDTDRLTPADRSLVRVALIHTRALEVVWATQTRLQLERARKLGIASPPIPDLSGQPECLPLQRG